MAPTTPATGGPETAQTLKPKLRAERAATYAQLRAVLDQIAALSPSGQAKPELTPEQTAQLAALRKQEQELSPLVDKLDDDLGVLGGAGASEEAIQEIVARRGGGKATTTISEGPKLDPETLSSVSSTAGTATIEVEAQDTKETKDVTKRKFDVQDLSYEQSRKKEVEEKGPGQDSGSSEETKYKVGLGGASKEEEFSVRRGDQVKSTSSSTEFKRGDGSVGVVIGSGTKQGQVNEQGEIVEGRESSTKQGAEVIFNREAVGAGASTTRDFTQIHREGLKTGVTTSADGRFKISVKETDDDPPQYLLVLTISLSGGVGGKASAERGKDAKGSADVSAKVSGSGVVTFRHRLSERDAEAYLAGLGVAAGGAAHGSDPEFAIIAAAVRGGGEASETLVPDVMAAFGSAEGARQMREGDSMEYSLAGKVEAEAGIGGKGGGFGVGAKGGVSAGGSRGCWRST